MHRIVGVVYGRQIRGLDLFEEGDIAKLVVVVFCVGIFYFLPCAGANKNVFMARMVVNP